MVQSADGCPLPGGEWPEKRNAGVSFAPTLEVRCSACLAPKLHVVLHTCTVGSTLLRVNSASSQVLPSNIINIFLTGLTLGQLGIYTGFAWMVHIYTKAIIYANN